MVVLGLAFSPLPLHGLPVNLHLYLVVLLVAACAMMIWLRQAGWLFRIPLILAAFCCVCGLISYGYCPGFTSCIVG